MGILKIGAAQESKFDDRALTHLRHVIINKLIKQESFLFTWVEQEAERSAWIHPYIDLIFIFDKSSTHPLNKDWIDLLMTHANSANGLKLLQEPE